MEKTWGIVLGHVRLTGGKMIVRIFTSQRGTVAFIVHGTYSRASSHRNAALMPLNIVEIDYEHRQTRELQTFREVQLLGQYVSLPYHPLKQTMALFLGEFLMYALRHEGENRELLRYLTTAMVRLDEAEESFTSFHLDVMRRVADFLGYGSDILQSMTLSQLVEYYRAHVPEFPELKSLPILHEVLH